MRLTTTNAAPFGSVFAGSSTTLGLMERFAAQRLRD